MKRWKDIFTRFLQFNNALLLNEKCYILCLVEFFPVAAFYHSIIYLKCTNLLDMFITGRIVGALRASTIAPTPKPKRK